MPVTITLESRPGELRPCDWRTAFGNAQTQQDPYRFLAQNVLEQYKGLVAKGNVGRVSFSRSENQTAILGGNPNGFVFTALNAYVSHYHLEIRPDDVWLCILTQLCTYMKVNCDDLCLHQTFVKHQGMAPLVLAYDISYESLDHAKYANDVLRLLKDNITHPQFVDWIIPAFSTSNLDDEVAAAIVAMGSFDAYFDYKIYSSSGLPSVTLLGTKEDWHKILARIGMLPTFGDEPAMWYELLTPILQRFVSSFEDPFSEATTEFWEKMVFYDPLHRGTNVFSGWLSAFCFWDREGNPPEYREQHIQQGSRDVILDAVKYHPFDLASVPPGIAAAAVTFILRSEGLREVSTTFVAGGIGMAAKRRQYWRDRPGDDLHPDTLVPVSAWFVFENKDMDMMQLLDPSIDELQQQLQGRASSSKTNPFRFPSTAATSSTLGLGISFESRAFPSSGTTLTSLPRMAPPTSLSSPLQEWTEFSRTLNPNPTGVFNQATPRTGSPIPSRMGSQSRAGSAPPPQTPAPDPFYASTSPAPNTVYTSPNPSLYLHQLQQHVLSRGSTPLPQIDIPTHQPIPTPQFEPPSRELSPDYSFPTMTLHPITATEMPMTHASFQHQMNVYMARNNPNPNPLAQVCYGGPPVPAQEHTRPELARFGVSEELCRYYGDYLERQRQAAWRRG